MSAPVRGGQSGPRSRVGPQPGGSLKPAVRKAASGRPEAGNRKAGITPGLYAFRLGAGTRCAVTCRARATAGGPRSVLARSSIRGRPFLTALALIRAPVGRRFDRSRSGRSGRARSVRAACCRPRRRRWRGRPSGRGHQLHRADKQPASGVMLAGGKREIDRPGDGASPWAIN